MDDVAELMGCQSFLLRESKSQNLEILERSDGQTDRTDKQTGRQDWEPPRDALPPDGPVDLNYLFSRTQQMLKTIWEKVCVGKKWLSTTN